MTDPVQGATSASPLHEINLQEPKPQDKKPVQLVKHSDAYNRTNALLTSAMDIGHLKNVDPSKYNRFKDVYNKTTYSINEDGSVIFTMNDEVNVADFREAYCLKEGCLRDYLFKRHIKGLDNDTVGIVKAQLYINGECTNQDDYDDSTPMPYGGGYITDSQGKMTCRYEISDRGSYLVYSDGMRYQKVKKGLAGTGNQYQYDEMRLCQGEGIKVYQNLLLGR